MSYVIIIPFVRVEKTLVVAVTMVVSCLLIPWLETIAQSEAALLTCRPIRGYVSDPYDLLSFSLDLIFYGSK